jgi:predicted RNase H-like HicB family nuclease
MSEWSPGIPGAHTQGASLDELNANLKEVPELCLEEYEGAPDDLPLNKRDLSRFEGLKLIP